MTDPKIDKIEELLAHQDQVIQDLSEMVTRQWGEIDALKKRLNKLQDKVSTIEESGPNEESGLSITEIAAHNKPPHY